MKKVLSVHCPINRLKGSCNKMKGQREKNRWLTKKEAVMEGTRRGTIHVMEFGCESPIRFYERCGACPRFDNCPDLALGKEILRGKNQIDYHAEGGLGEGVDAKKFNCLAPLNYFEKTRKMCAHKGRCREEGLLLALLSGKKKLDYAQKTAIQFPRPMHREKKAVDREERAKEMAG